MQSVRNDLEPRCTECKGKIVLGILEERECVKCGKKAFDREVCENGHYLCEECRKKIVSNIIYNKCIDSEEKDPIKLALKIMADDSVRMHDLKHHTMVAACLLTAYKNCGGDIDLDAALRTAEKRGSWFPGGVCGLAGTCGACASCGIFYSIITETTPHSTDTWSDTNMMTAKCLEKIASINGPRCCKRNSFLAMQTATSYVKEKLDIELPTSEDVECPYSDRNEECIKGKCPFYKS